MSAPRLSRLSALAGQLARLCGAGAAVLLLAVTVLMLADVVGRGLGQPLFGAQDLAELAMVLVTFGALALLERGDAQIRVDLFKPLMAAWLVRAGERAAALVAGALYLALAKALWDSAALSELLHLASNILKLPKAPVQYGAAALAATAGVTALLRALLPAGADQGPKAGKETA